MYRISTTSLEAFRRWRDGHSRWDTEERVIQTLEGLKEPNAYAAIGSVFHRIVETGRCSYAGNNLFVEKQDGFDVKMNLITVDNALYYRSKYPGAEHEVHGGMDFDCGAFPIHVHGYADIKYGSVIRDIKTKYSKPFLNDYTDSCQWSIYLQLFDCSTFYFDLFLFYDYDRSMGTDVSETEMVAYKPIPCFRSEESDKKNEVIIKDFTNWVKGKKLFHLLKTKEDLYAEQNQPDR